MNKLQKILSKVDTREKIREKARVLGRKIPKAPKDLPEPNLSQNAAYIAKTRYAFRDEKGEPKETPKEMFWRIAYYIAAADTIYSKQNLRSSSFGKLRTEGLKKTHLKSAREFYKLMAAQKFIPN